MLRRAIDWNGHRQYTPPLPETCLGSLIGFIRAEISAALLAAEAALPNILKERDRVDKANDVEHDVEFITPNDPNDIAGRTGVDNCVGYLQPSHCSTLSTSPTNQTRLLLPLR